MSGAASSRGGSLPSETEVIAEALVRMFEENPELLPLIERILARRRAAAQSKIAPEPPPAPWVQERRLAQEIRAVEEVILLPRYADVDKSRWTAMREALERLHPAMVLKIRTRIEHAISQSKPRNRKPYATRSVEMVNGGRRS